MNNNILNVIKTKKIDNKKVIIIMNLLLHFIVILIKNNTLASGANNGKISIYGIAQRKVTI